MPAYRSSKASSRFSKGSSSSSDKSVKAVQDDLRCIRGAVASRPEPSAVRHRSPARGGASSRGHSSRARPVDYQAQTFQPPRPAVYEPVMPQYPYYASPAQFPRQDWHAHQQSDQQYVEDNPFWVRQAPAQYEEAAPLCDYVYSDPIQHYSSPPRPPSISFQPPTITPRIRLERFSFSSPARINTPVSPPLPDIFSTAYIPLYQQHSAPRRALYHDERPTTARSSTSWRPPSTTNDLQLFVRPEAAFAVLPDPQHGQTRQYQYRPVTSPSHASFRPQSADEFPFARPETRINVLPDSHAQPRQMQYLNELEGRDWETRSVVSTASRDYASQGENEFHFAAAPIYGSRR